MILLCLVLFMTSCLQQPEDDDFWERFPDSACSCDSRENYYRVIEDNAVLNIRTNVTCQLIETNHTTEKFNRIFGQNLSSVEIHCENKSFIPMDEFNNTLYHCWCKK